MTNTEKRTAPAGGRPMVSAQDVHKRFGHVEVLKGISMDVASGEVMCLIGP